MLPRLASIVCLSLFASNAFVGAQNSGAPEVPKEAKVAKKYHVYTYGCRLGVRLVAATDNPNEVLKAIEEPNRQGSTIQVVAGPHDRNDVGVAKPVRYQVFGDGPRRCGTMRLLATTEKEPDYDAISENGFLHPCFTVVSFR